MVLKHFAAVRYVDNCSRSRTAAKTLALGANNHQALKGMMNSADKSSRGFSHRASRTFGVLMSVRKVSRIKAGCTSTLFRPPIILRSTLTTAVSRSIRISSQFPQTEDTAILYVRNVSEVLRAVVQDMLFGRRKAQATRLDYRQNSGFSCERVKLNTLPLMKHNDASASSTSTCPEFSLLTCFPCVAKCPLPAAFVRDLVAPSKPAHHVSWVPRWVRFLWLSGSRYG